MHQVTRTPIKGIVVPLWDKVEKLDAARKTAEADKAYDQLLETCDRENILVNDDGIIEELDNGVYEVLLYKAYSYVRRIGDLRD